MSISVGIDIAKASFVVSDGSARSYELSNSVAGVAELVKRLPEGACIHLEASGGYERLVRRGLREAGFKVLVHNPLKARRLSQALSSGAKTDPVDARHLATSASLLPVHPAKSEEREALADFSRVIDGLKTKIGEFRKALGQVGLDGDAEALLRGVIEDLVARCNAAEKAFVKRVKESTLGTDYRLVLTVPGIGPVAARVCLCELPENYREVSPAAIAAYAGLAPIDRSSGTFRGKAHIAQGNKRLRTGLYMGALAIVKTEPWAKNLYQRLREKNKHHQVALVAVMRKLLLRAVAVLKRKTPWTLETIPN